MNRHLPLLLLLLACMNAAGQNRTATTPAAARTTLVPQFTIKLGAVGNGASIKEQVAAMLKAPLTVTDQKNARYPVTGFRFMYLAATRYEDEETGEVRRGKDLRVGEFTGTDRLSDMWIRYVSETLAKGDELRFSRVVVRLPDGKRMMAPELAITIN